MNTGTKSIKPWLIYLAHICVAAIALLIIAEISHSLTKDTYLWDSAVKAYRSLCIVALLGIFVRDGFTLSILMFIDHAKKRSQSSYRIMSLVPSIVGSLLLGIGHLVSVGSFVSIYGGSGEGGLAPFIYTVLISAAVSIAQLVIIVMSLTSKRTTIIAQ